MADVVANISKGEVNSFVRRVDTSDPSTSRIVQVLFKTIEADSALIDYDTLALALAAGGGTANVECDFTNYARKVLAAADLTSPAPDDTNNWQQADVPDWVIANAGGASNNTLVKIGHFYLPDVADVADNTEYRPLSWHDLSETTNGLQLTVAPTTAQVFFRAV